MILSVWNMTRSEQQTSETYDVGMIRRIETLLYAEARRIYRPQRGEKRIKVFDIHHVWAIG